MMNKRLLILAAVSALSLGGLAGCTTGFRADVSRFQQLPPAQGQTFTVMPGEARLAGSLEFNHYADLVAQRLSDQGYVHSTDPGAAQLVVTLDYGIDKGTQRIRSSGFGRDPFFYDPFYYPGYYRGWGGWRGRYMMGFNDPFLWGSGFSDIESYVVYQSRLRMKINRVDGEPLFEGTARAQSVSNKMTYLVPNLIDALFTGFPGKNGEEVRVTVAPEPKG
ncbi:MAG TPA: DUF4136 domain-containing protein [Sphingobium sp.]|nr:DUF4136 domain-containing protein [Sphingobium sp.]